MYRFYTSVRHAWHGLAFLVKEERNFRIHLMVAIAVLCLAWILDFLPWEFALLSLTIALVLLTEIINTVSEKIIDMTKPRLHFYAGMVKDMMAAAVLLSVCMAICVGIALFFPHIEHLF